MACRSSCPRRCLLRQDSNPCPSGSPPPFPLSSCPGLARPLRILAGVGAGALGLALWLGWAALLAGVAPAIVQSQSPGFSPILEPFAFGAALAITALWLFSWTLALPGRWLAGVTLVWGLAMTLWLPWLDHAKSYRGVIADMQRARPKGQCVTARDLTEPQRAMFHYFAGIRAGGPADCPLLLWHTPSIKPPAVGEGWELRWRGTRPGDTKEFFWLYERVRSVAALSWYRRPRAGGDPVTRS